MQQSTDNINSFLHTIVCLIIWKMWLPSNNHSLFLFRYMIKHKHCHLRHLELLIPLDAADLNDDSEWVLLCPDDCCCIGAIQNHLLVFFWQRRRQPVWRMQRLWKNGWQVNRWGEFCCWRKCMRNNKLTSNLSPIFKSVWCCCAMRSFGRGQVRSCIRAIVAAAGLLTQYLPAPDTNSPF